MANPAVPAPALPAPAADRNVKLTEFEGDKTSFSEWAQHVHMCLRIAPWNDSQTAQRVKLQLKGTAAVWLNNRIAEGTEGLDAWFPEEGENGVRPPNLRTLLEERFSISHTPAEQANLRSTLQQKENENVAAFYDRCQSVQFELDKGFTVAFRVDSKAQYEIVHQQQLLNNFICGLKQNIRKHVTTANANTCQTARAAAIAFELGNKAAAASRIASTSYSDPTSSNSVSSLATQVTGMVMAQMRGQGGQRGQRGGRGGGQTSQQPESTDEGFCTYCGYVGHQRPKCNIRKKDEAKGLYLPQSPYFSPGRIGRGGRGGRGVRGGQATRGRVSEMAEGAAGFNPSPWQHSTTPQPQQQMQALQQQPQQPPAAQNQATFYNDQGGAAAFCEPGAFRFYPPQQAGNQ